MDEEPHQRPHDPPSLSTHTAVLDYVEDGPVQAPDLRVKGELI